MGSRKTAQKVECEEVIRSITSRPTQPFYTPRRFILLCKNSWLTQSLCVSEAVSCSHAIKEKFIDVDIAELMDKQQ